MIVIATMTIMSSYSKPKIFFSATIYALCVWLSVQYVVQLFSLDGIIGLKLIQFISAIPFAIAILFYGFIRSYINKPVSRKAYIYLLLFFVLELVLNMTDFIIQSAWGDPNGIVISQSTYLYQVYIVAVALVFAVSIYQLLKSNIDTRSKKDKARNRLLIIGSLQAVIVLVIGSVFFKKSSEAQAVIPVSLLVMSIIVGLAIVKYRFFDIKFAIIRTSAYIMSLMTLSVLYYGLAYLLSIALFKGQVNSGISVNPINIFLALLLAFVFQPVKKGFDKITNRFFYKDNYNSDDFFARLNKTLSSTIDLRGLLERTAVEIGHTLKGEQAFFFINTNDGHYMSAGTLNHKQLPKNDALQLNINTKNNDNVIIASLLNDSDPTRRLMLSHRIELVLPLLRGGEVIGYLCLGDHLTSSYTPRDIKVLNTISNELIIAIKNALAVQEIREFNETLKQRIANATKELRTSNSMLRRLDKAKDEFVSMASHQLRTPLTSVKGYISMVLDGDAGQVSSSQRQLLDEAFNSSERMVRLINDFLNVSRIQTGKFIIDKHPIDMSQLIEQEIDSLQSSAIVHNMKFIYNPPKNFPMVDIDEGKIRQVVMNFADNAIYYSNDNSDININLSVDSDNIVFTIKDTGIGVPAAEQDELFTKFYRASNAKKQRPDGTGVGLYLAKKIINAHKGKVIFESAQDKGSTFGFSIPINQA